MRRHQLATIVILFGQLMVCAQANAQPISRSTGSENFLDGALARGDRGDIERQLANNKNQVIKDLSRALLNGNTEVVSRSANACMQGSFKAGRHEVTAFCNQILARSYLASGNLKKWSETVRWFLDVALPEMKKDPLNRFAVDTSPDNKIDHNLISKTGDLKQVLSSTSSELPIDLNLLEKWRIPFVSIKVNGQKILALVDTGSPYSLILSRSLANRLEATTVATGLSLIDRRSAIPPSDDLALVSSVEMGPLLVKNVGAVVIDKAPLEEAEAIVGLSFIQRFPVVGFGKESLSIHPEIPSGCTTPEQLVFATSKGRSNLLFPISIDGTATAAIFDTGSQSLLVVPATFQSALPKGGKRGSGARTEMKKIFSGGGEFTTSLSTTESELKVLNQPMGRQPVVQTTEGVWDFPWLGAPTFSKRKLFVSFSEPKACFSK